MKKYLKVLSVLSLAFVAAGVVGLKAPKQFTADAQTNDSFAMVTGASIRIPDTVTQGSEVSYENDGLRFTAKIDKATYDGYITDGFTVTAGTFLMPIQYYTENEDLEIACFTNPVYYWETGKDLQGNPVYSSEVTGTKKQILHVKGTPYQKNSSDSYYTLNGSVLNLKDDSVLNIKFIGVSYLQLDKAGTTIYEFATTSTSNARSVVDVAQQALLSVDDSDTTNDAEALLDENGDVDVSKQTAVKAEYWDKYVSLYEDKYTVKPSYTYVVKTYKQISKTNYALTSEEKTVEMTSYNQTVNGEAQSLSDYAYFTANENNVKSAQLLFNGTAELVQYYNYTAKREVLFDGESGRDGWLNESTADADGVKGVKSQETTMVYEGNASMKIDPNVVNGWAGLKWGKEASGKCHRLNFETNTFSVDIYSPVDTNNMEAVYLKGFTKAGDWKQFTAYLSLERGWNNYIITTTDKFFDIFDLEFRTVMAGGSVFYVDNFCAVDTTEGLVIPENQDGYDKNATKIDFKVDTLGTAVLLGDVTELAVSYRVAGTTSAYTSLTANNGVYTIANATSPNYEVKVSGKINGNDYSVTEIIGKAILDFETESEYKYSIAGGSTAKAERSTEYVYSGSYASKLYTGNGWAAVILNTLYKYSYGASKICFYAYSPSANDVTVNVDAYVADGNNTGWSFGQSVVLKHGWHKYELALTYNDQYRLRGIGFGNAGTDVTVYVDGVWFE